jgi:hypothetical protein
MRQTSARFTDPASDPAAGAYPAGLEIRPRPPAGSFAAPVSVGLARGR